MARPSKYETEVKPYLKQVNMLVNAGCSDSEIAEFLKISERTFYYYKENNDEFLQSLKKNAIVKEVKKTLENRLLGKIMRVRRVYENVEKNPLAKDKEDLVLIRIEEFTDSVSDSAFKDYLKTYDEDWKETVETNTSDVKIEDYLKEVISED